MPFYGQSVLEEGAYEPIADQPALLEAFIADEISMLADDDRKAFIESDECKALEEAGLLGKKTIVRLSKNDDLTRRIKIAAFMKAKEKDDPTWNALVKNRQKERELINKLMGKYSNLVKRDAINGQKELLKVSPKSFNRPIGR